MPEELTSVFRYAVSLWAFGIFFLDLHSRRIPNGLNLSAALVAVASLMLWSRGLLGASPVSCLAATALALVLTVPAYLRKALGGGDVKLMMAIGLMGGVRVLVFTFVIAGLIAAMWLVRYFVFGTGARVAVRLPSANTSQGHSESARPVPFGAALALGLLCAVNMPADWLTSMSSGWVL